MLRKSKGLGGGRLLAESRGRARSRVVEGGDMKKKNCTTEASTSEQHDYRFWAATAHGVHTREVGDDVAGAALYPVEQQGAGDDDPRRLRGLLRANCIGFAGDLK